jgi:hypothetical protein
MMANILTIVAALIILWFAWLKYQQTKWRHVADDLLFETYKELMATDFDVLVAQAGEPHKTETRRIGGHRFEAGWRIDKFDAHPESVAGITKIDDGVSTDIRSGQLPWIKEVEVWMYVNFISLVPFVRSIQAGHSHYIQRNRAGSASLVRPFPEADAFPVKSQLMHLAGLTVGDACSVADGADKPEITLAACADAMAKTKGYCAYAAMGTRWAEDRVEWLLDFEKPDRFHVTQLAGEDRDAWITIGQDTFRYLGDWLLMPGGTESPNHINEIFPVDLCLEELRGEPPVSVRVCRIADRRPRILTLGPVEIGFGFQKFGEREFVLFEYETYSIGRGDLDGAGEHGSWQVTFWIDGATGMLERMDAATEIPDKRGGYSGFLLKQVFAYTSPAVSRPEDYQEMN